MKQQMKMLDNACDTVERPGGESHSPGSPEKNMGEPRTSTVFPTTSTTPNRKRPVDSSEEEDRLDEEDRAEMDHFINDNEGDLSEGKKPAKAPEVLLDVISSQDLNPPNNDLNSATIGVSPSTVSTETHTNVTTETKLWERPPRKRSRDNQGEDQGKSSKRQKIHDDLKNSNKLSKSSNINLSISPLVSSPFQNNTPLWVTELSQKLDHHEKTTTRTLSQIRQTFEKSIRQQQNQFRTMLEEALHQQKEKYHREREETEQALKQRMQKVLKDQKMQIETILKKQKTMVEGAVGEIRESLQVMENKMMDVRTAVEGLRRREKEWVGATARHYEEMARTLNRMCRMVEEEEEEVSGRGSALTVSSGTPNNLANRQDDDNVEDLNID